VIPCAVGHPPVTPPHLGTCQTPRNRRACSPRLEVVMNDLDELLATTRAPVLPAPGGGHECPRRLPRHHPRPPGRGRRSTPQRRSRTAAGDVVNPGPGDRVGGGAKRGGG